MPPPRRVNVHGLARLPAFSHATVAGGQVFVSGVLGSKPGGLELVDGGIVAQTWQTLRNMEAVLHACGCVLENLAKVSVYLTDMELFADMNGAYLEVIGDDPPARITVGCQALALGALVEMDAVAFLPGERPDG